MESIGTLIIYIEAIQGLNNGFPVHKFVKVNTIRGISFSDAEKEVNELKKVIHKGIYHYEFKPDSIYF